jgi:two-component system, NarL family, invasion response regulator UvrY
MEKKMTTIALADDHVLLRNALASLLNEFQNCKVILQADSGKQLIEQIKRGIVPDIVLLDLNMPEFGGYETAEWLQKNHPGINILMLTMYDTELTLIRLLQLGVKGFLKKYVHN